jgi:DNA adenine methylase
MQYPGGKGKVFQHVINLLPRHATYIETHLGGGAVLLHKRPSAQSIGIDRNPSLIRFWRQNFPHLADYVEGDALEFLTSYRFCGDELVYSDPPYLPSTRCRRRVYRYDYQAQDHKWLLEALLKLPCKVVISGYPSEMYDTTLGKWHSHSFTAKTHSGVRVETLWFNYDPPDCLHDVRYLGANFRERQTFRRRLDRLRRRIASLSPQEQHHLSEWLTKRLCEK